jgi:hypothetical protein
MFPKRSQGGMEQKLFHKMGTNGDPPKEINSYENQWEQTSQVVVPIRRMTKKTIIKYQGN